MKTSQKRSISSWRWPSRRSSVARTSRHSAAAGVRPRSRSVTRAIRSRDESGRWRVAEEPEARPDRRRPAVLVDHRQARAARAGARPPCRSARGTAVLLEAAERDVLAVVGRRRRVALALGQRLHGAAERRPRLVQHDLVAGVDELERGREAGEPAADDRDLPRATIVTPLDIVTLCPGIRTAEGRLSVENVTGGSRPRSGASSGRQLRRAVEDVEAARLDPLERRPVEARERADAGGAAVVEVVEQGQALRQIGARPGAPGTPSAPATPGVSRPAAMSSSATPYEASSSCGR